MKRIGFTARIAVRSLLGFIERGEKDEAKRVLQARRFPLGWQSNK